MEINLRRANALQISLTNQLKKLEPTARVSLTEFHDAGRFLDESREKFLAQVRNSDELISAIYNLRNLISQTNSQAGVDYILTEIAGVEKHISLYEGLLKNPVQEPIHIIRGRLEKLANPAQTHYGRDEIESTVLLAEDVAEFESKLGQLVRQRQSLQDQLLEINVRTKVELTALLISVLNKYSLL